MRAETAPATRLPNGVVPKYAIRKNAITRPRFVSSTIVWSSVLLDATCTMKPKLATTSSATESHSTREKANATRPHEKMAPATGMLRPSPVIVRRDASQSAPSSAPPPVAVMRNPSVCAPPPRISAAKTGMSTVYGTPTRQISPMSRMIDRIGRDVNA